MQNAKNLYVLSGTDALTRGILDNVALGDNLVQLDQSAGRHVLYGCYTSPVVNFAPFDRLVMSWNATTPEGTVVEAQARVLVQDSWTSWFSFGKWSPYIARASIWQEGGGLAYIQGDTVFIPGGKATQAQLRIYLYTEDERLSPTVRLLAASVRPTGWEKQPAAPYERQLRLPAYSQHLRSPALQAQGNAPVALASLLNRYGLDILPEELAAAMFDHQLNSWGNRSFAAALAGGLGFEAYYAYMDPAALWTVAKVGHSAAAELSYAAPPAEGEALPAGPVLTGCFAPAQKQLMPLRGFAMQGSQLLALVNDTLAPGDETAEREYPAEEFWAAYTGAALVVKGKQRGRDAGRPLRRHLALRTTPQVGVYVFQTQEGSDLPLPESFAGTLACTLREDTARATTAHKDFYYLERSEEGGVMLPPELLTQGKKITVYAIFPSGCALVAEVNATSSI